MLWWKRKTGKQGQPEKQIKKPSAEKVRIVDGFIRKAMELAREEKSPHNWIFDVPGTKNEAILSVEQSGDKQTVAVMVRRKGSSYVTMHYLFTGTREEVELFLSEPEHADKMVNSVWELSASVDDQADEYPFYG